MKNLGKILFEIGGITVYFLIFLVNFFWYMLIGEDTELNTHLTYISYIGFYLIFSLLVVGFLIISKGRASKIILILMGFMTLPLWKAGYEGPAEAMAPENGLVYTRLTVLVIHCLIIAYAVLRTLKITFELRKQRYEESLK